MAGEVTTRIGPDMHGMKMSLEEFMPAEGKEGYSYELERGVIGAERPRFSQSRVIANVHSGLLRWELSNPGKVFLRAGGRDVVVFIRALESERHPDIAIYLSPPPNDDETPWDFWMPDAVFEVVTETSIERDYVIKREEYLRVGIPAYCIVDPLQRVVVVLTRKGDIWQETRLTSSAKLTVPMLPGFALPIDDVFASVHAKRAR